MIKTKTRIQYANGYIELGMYDDASDELEAIEGEDRMSVEVMSVRAMLYFHAKQWELMEATSRFVAEQKPDFSLGWVNWANALRFQGKFEEAKHVGSKGLELHPENGPLWYNMACYCSLMGDQREAKELLHKAASIDEEFKKTAIDDPDLDELWKWIH